MIKKARGYNSKGGGESEEERDIPTIRKLPIELRRSKTKRNKNSSPWERTTKKM